MSRRPPPEICPQCGAEVPRNAAACPECGSDYQTGWSEAAQLDRLGVPGEDFDYDEFVKEEFGQPDPGHRLKPQGLAWFWWAVAVLLLVCFALWMLSII